MENNLEAKTVSPKNSRDYFKTAAIVLSVVFISLLIFSLGVAVGTKKARFSEHFGKNYERNFAPAPPGPMGFFDDFEGRRMRNAHGIIGTVISASFDKITMKDRENNEVSVSISEKTAIRERRNDLNITDLKNGQKIVVLGRPQEDGSIKADFIRVLKNIDENNNA